MKDFNFNNKTFSLISNSEEGKVNAETIFEYKQKDNLITADYYGGIIQYGKIIGILKESKINMLYQCLTINNELKAGKAIAEVSFTDDEKIKLKLNWEWLDGKGEKGVSEYLEN